MTEPSAASIPRTVLGSGLEVSRLGFGCMVLTKSYATPDPAESIATFHAALDRGMKFLDTSNAYAQGENETFVGNAIKGRRDEVTLASKFGLRLLDGPVRKLGVDARPEYLKKCCDESLSRLGVDYLDLYYAHRLDPNVPVEDTVGAMAELVAEGKVRYLGLSETTAEELRRGHAVHPIAALSSEWSLWARRIEGEVLTTARELGVGIVPYSPLGRGFLTGAFASAKALEPGDIRATDNRLNGAEAEHNQQLLKTMQDLAARKGASLAQLALGWLLAQGTDVVPIPGIERREYLTDNLGAFDVSLDADDLALLDATFPPAADAAAGDTTDFQLRNLKPTSA